MVSVTIQREVSPFISEPRLPSDPSLRAIADDILAKLRFTLTALAADESPATLGVIDKMFRDYLATRETSSRTRLRERSRALLDSPSTLKSTHFGRYAAIDIKDYRKSGSDGLSSRVGRLALEPGAILHALEKQRYGLSRQLPQIPEVNTEPEILDSAGKKVDLPLSAEAKDLLAGLLYRKLKLYIHSVYCFDETGAGLEQEGGPSDEINIGGLMIDPFGQISMINQFEVSDNFDAGESVIWEMNKVFMTWDLVTKSPGFPYLYIAIIVLAEKDDGGFYKFLKQLWEGIKAEVLGYIGGAIGALVGAFAGVVGAIVGAIAGAFIGWLISLFDNSDEILGVRILPLALGGCTKTYYNDDKVKLLLGRNDALDYRGDNAHYRVNVAWRVEKPGKGG